MNRFSPSRIALSLFLAAGMVAAVPAQRGVRTLTAVGAAEVRVSPNRNWVSYFTTVNGVRALGIVPSDGTVAPRTLVTDIALTTFVWSPDSTGLYYQLGSELYFVATVGGTPVSVATVPGINVRLMDVDPQDKLLVGTRSDPMFGGAIFTVPTNGSATPIDIRTDPGLFFGEVQVDPTGTRICYTAQATGIPHAPIDVRVIDLDGKNDGSWSGGELPRTAANFTLPRDLTWADASTVMFSAIDTAVSTWELLRVTATNNDPEQLTLPPQQFQRCRVVGDTAVFVQSTFHGTQTVGLMPAAGGARIPLEPEIPWVVAGRPSIDSGGSIVAFAGYLRGDPLARPEVQVVDLDREIRIEPRPTLNQPLTFTLPLRVNERGTLFLSTGLGSNDPAQQFQVPGFEYGVALDPVVLLPLRSAVGNGSTPLQFTVTVPNDTALIGFTAYLQGLRIRRTAPDEGDFTRYAELQFHN